jgi:peptide/nickel transport system substrate-binding protein
VQKFKNMDRRRFLSTAGVGIATAAALPWLDPNVALAAGGTLTVALPNNPTTFDPANQRNHDAMAMSQVIFENLYEVDVNAEPQPMLAVGHKVADDGMTWWFDLRDDVVFHNGQKMTAEDVKYSYDWILDAKNKARRRSVWTRIKNIVVESPTRVRFEMAQPYGSMLYYMTKYMGIFPKGSREKHGAAAFTSNPVGLGTGPGIFVGARKNDYVEFKRNPNYWRKGVPAWNKLIAQVVPENAVRVAYLITNQVQIISAPPPREFVRLKDLPGIQGHSKVSVGGRCFIGINNNRKPFDDLNFRKAVTHAIDRQKIADQFYGLLEPSALPMGKDSPWFSKEANAMMDFDLALAKKYMAKSKYATDAEFDLLLPASPYLVDVKDAALIIQAQLKENLGVKVNLQVLETGQVIGDMIRGNFTSAIVVFMTPADPVERSFYTGQILAKGYGYKNPAFDAAVDDYYATNDAAKQKKILDRLFKIVGKDSPMFYLGVPHAANLWRKDVKGFKINAAITMRLRDVDPGSG